MREILSTTSLSLVESLLVALDAAGIEARTTNETAVGLPFNPIHVFVVNEQDYDRAVAILRSVHVAVDVTRPSGRRRRRVTRILVLALLALIAAVCAEVFFH